MSEITFTPLQYCLAKFREKGYPRVIEKLSRLLGLQAGSRPVKWQGLNVSRRPTDGQQCPNPGEEAARVQQGADFQQWPAVVLTKLCRETCRHVPPELHLAKVHLSFQCLGSLMPYSVPQQCIRLIRGNHECAKLQHTESKIESTLTVSQGK